MPQGNEPDIRAILFDFSGVIKINKKNRNKAIFAEIERLHDVDEKALRKEIERLGCEDAKHDNVTGYVDEALRNLVGEGLTPWSDTYERGRIMTDNMELVKRLRGSFKTAIVANSGGHVEERMVGYGIREFFDVVLDSGIAGVRKPEPGIYLLAAEMLGVTPEQCLFVDNKQPNIEGALNVGMQAVFFDETTESLETLLSPYIGASALP